MAFNLYSSFKNLLPSSPVSVVTVIITLPDGNSQVRTSDGITITVGGDSVEAGNKAYVKDGAITSVAPNITTVRVEI